MPSEQVVHAGIADHDDLVDPLRQHPGLLADLGDVAVEEAHDASGELAQVGRG